MKKIVNQITDISQIQKELELTVSGVLAFYSKDEEVVQDAVNFLYKDKNIFIFFDDEDEFYEKIDRDSLVSFTTIRSSSLEQNKMNEQPSDYYLFSITINGSIKSVDDKKLLSLLLTDYSQKYNLKSLQESTDILTKDRILYIDSEEIQAFEEIGE